MRIAKAMARAGLCSRRDAERWIDEGRVEVNGAKITSPALDVAPGDRIMVDGALLPATEPTRLWRYSKPRGVVTTHRDPEGRPTVFEGLPDDMPRVLSIGRLDYNTEGLLLLTTDGELARYLELPATGWLRRYRVRAHGRVTQDQLDELKDGVTIAGVHYGPVEATLDSQKGANVWLTVGLREGKNREVRNILAELGLEVNRLIRVSFGPFQLLDMKPGTVEPVRRKVLAEQLGVKLAKRFKLAPDADENAAPSRPRTGERRARQQEGPQEGQQEGQRERHRERQRNHRSSPSERGRSTKATNAGARDTETDTSNTGTRNAADTAPARPRRPTDRRPDRSTPGRTATARTDTRRPATRPRTTGRPPNERHTSGSAANKSAPSAPIDVDENQLDDFKPWSAAKDDARRPRKTPPGKPRPPRGNRSPRKRKDP